MDQVIHGDELMLRLQALGSRLAKVKGKVSPTGSLGAELDLLEQRQGALEYRLHELELGSLGGHPQGELKRFIDGLARAIHDFDKRLGSDQDR